MIYKGPTYEEHKEIFSTMDNPTEAMWPCKLCLRPWQDHMLLTKWCPIGGPVSKQEFNKRIYGDIDPVQSYVPMDNFQYVEFSRRQHEKI